MKQGENRRFVLYDPEEEYAQLMTEFLRGHKDLPWEVHTYTEAESLLKEERGRVAILAAAESAYTDALQELAPGQIVILNESGLVRQNAIRNINKYQEAESVLRELLEAYMEVAGEEMPWMQAVGHTRFIGIYSPVRRCLQTTFALTMGQILAEEHRTLYLNFEHYAGMDELLPDRQEKDLADLLYFLAAGREKFGLRLRTMIRRNGNLDYIPPMKYGQNLLPVTGGEWLHLLRRIGEIGEYEYVILDLSEDMQGLFDILRLCTRVFTLTKDDRIARSKLLQYEQLLALCEYGDVLEKTLKCGIPHIRRLPEALEQYTKGDLADYVKKQLQGIR